MGMVSPVNQTREPEVNLGRKQESKGCRVGAAHKVQGSYKGTGGAAARKGKNL